MRLYVTVAAAPGLNWSGAPGPTADGLLSDLASTAADLVLDLESKSGSVLEDCLNREAPGEARFWVEGRRLTELQAGVPPLVSGAVIVATPPNGPPPSRPRGTGHELTFAVLSGPDTGAMQVLRRGRYSIGRTAEDIPIADAELSRLHAELVVEPTNVRIEDKGSANGTSIDRHKRESGLISTESVILMGSSRCGLRFSSDFRDFDDSPADPSHPLIVQRESVTQRRGVMLLTALLPVVIGVGLALITGMWMFLAFSAMSALTMLVPVLGGRKRRRKFERELESADQSDSARRTAATPSISEVIRYTIQHSRQDRGVAGSTAVNKEWAGNGMVLAGWVRLGTADQSANVRPDPPDRDFVPSVLPALPVSLNLGQLRQISITGNSQQVSAMLRSLTIQISSWTSGAEHRLIFYGPITNAPSEIRYLPRAEMVHTPSGFRASLETASDSPAVLFLAQEIPISEDLDSLLQHHIATGMLTIIRYGEQMAHAGIPTVTLLRDGAILKNAGGADLEFVADLVSAGTFERFCRSKAKLDMAHGSGQAGPTLPALPKVKPLDSLIDITGPRIRERWSLSEGNSGLEALIGVGRTGDMSLDLQRDGPHLLLAGTTGSGKSELLRTLILSLCMSRSPSLVNFLLVDFKGGSGLGPLRRLPHSVGLLTDLSSESVQRAMESLRAEVRRRESLFAEVEAGDLASYRRLRDPGQEEVPHLVIVIDEFRMLLEEVPAAMDELLRIASIGRSLGLHLIMATQRPQGAISADIRANITTSISLRVQTAMESQDILGSSEAAGISLASPGRAYLKRSGEPAQGFQSASSALMSILKDPVRVRLPEQVLLDNSDSPMIRQMESDEAALVEYIEAPLRAWRAAGGTEPRQPVLPDLPDQIPASGPGHYPDSWADDGSAINEAAARVTLGVLDLPSRQQQVALHWTPRDDSHLALAGGPRSGVDNTMRNVAAQLVASGTQDVHLYVLDADGSLPGLDGKRPVGAYVTAHDVRRATRVIQRLAECVSIRLAAGDQSGRSRESADDRPGASSSTEQPTLVLLLSGWGRWLSAIRSSPWAAAEETIQDVVRDGARVGVIVVIGGDRELVTARMFSNIENRLYLPAGASAESLMAWPRLPAMKRIAGRAYVEGKIALHPGIAQLIPCNDSDWEVQLWSEKPEPALAVPPFRVDPMPRVLRAADVPNAETGPDEILAGVQGDQLQPAIVRMPPGGVFVVLGAPQSGKTATLRMLAHQGPPGRRWMHLAADSLDGEIEHELLLPDRKGLPVEEGTGQVPSTILVDDADQLSAQAQQYLIQLNSKGIGVILSAANSPSAMSRVPLASVARAAGRGIVLMPRSTFDGEFFGVRLDTEPTPPPGRAAIIDGNTSREAQLIHVPEGHDR
ncbi:MAG TPA: FtsK/SpoIIIE domain-containing protein [Arthrobacter sp.]|nr:FtsK/SpoIIIE domain-containing protein [Arthrobacter sp.]